MTYSIHEKALAIHRIIKCGMQLQPGHSTMDAMQAASSLSGKWVEGENLMLTVAKAFKVWEQRWRVQRERDIVDADSLELDTTDVDHKPPREYYIVPEGKEREYVEVYDIVHDYRPLTSTAQVGYISDSALSETIVGAGNGLIEKAKSFRDIMEARRDARRKGLADKLGIN